MLRQRVDIDHWHLLSDAASVERIVEALDTLLENNASTCSASLFHAEAERKVSTAEVLAWRQHPLHWAECAQVASGHFHISESPNGVCLHLRRQLGADPPQRAHS
ncbi:hypothetical protein ACFSVK_14900 [Azorhizophilus paspali]|uniref:hypothetical protein n=1 Tax=Azorhizophilus paspali TaxID=69963 RepID=UPI00363CCE97